MLWAPCFTKSLELYIDTCQFMFLLLYLASTQRNDPFPSLGAGVKSKRDLVCGDINTHRWRLWQLRNAVAD